MVSGHCYNELHIISLACMSYFSHLCVSMCSPCSVLLVACGPPIAVLTHPGHTYTHAHTHTQRWLLCIVTNQFKHIENLVPIRFVGDTYCCVKLIYIITSSLQTGFNLVGGSFSPKNSSFPSTKKRLPTKSVKNIIVFLPFKIAILEDLKSHEEHAPRPMPLVIQFPPKFKILYR